MLVRVYLDRDLSISQPASVTMSLEEGGTRRALRPLLVLLAVLKSLYEQVLLFLFELKGLQEEPLMTKVLTGILHHFDADINVYLFSTEVEFGLLHLAFDHFEVFEFRESDLSVQVLDEAVDRHGAL